MVCSCFGHREIYWSIKEELLHILETFVKECEDITFLTGGMGETDRLFSECVRILKKQHPGIKLILVLPYMTNALNRNKDYYTVAFDDIIIPEEMADVHYKAAIEKRNCWIVDQCDVILDCTYRDFGGAYSAIKYAHKQQKTVIEINKNRHQHLKRN